MSTSVVTKVKPDVEAPYPIQLLEGLLPLFFGLELLAWLIILPAAMRGHADFRQLYTAGYMVRTGHAHELYNYNSQLRFQSQLVGPAQIPLPFIRPAYCTLLFAALSVIKYRNAYLVFMGMNLTFLAISWWLMSPWLSNLERLWSWFPALLFLSFYPVSAALLQGQDSILLLALMAGSLALASRNRELEAGLLLGLGLFKFQIVIPMAVLFVLWRRWRFVAGFALSTAIVLAISISIAGLAASSNYIHLLIFSKDSVSRSVNDVAYPILTQFMTNLHGLIFGMFAGHLSAILIKTITFSLSVAILLRSSFVVRSQICLPEMFSMAVVTAAVTSYYLFLHDLSVLLIPATSILDKFAGGTGDHKLEHQWLSWTAVFLFVAPICDLFLGHFRYLLSLPVILLLFAMLRSVRSSLEQGQLSN